MTISAKRFLCTTWKEHPSVRQVILVSPFCLHWSRRRLSFRGKWKVDMVRGDDYDEFSGVRSCPCLYGRWGCFAGTGKIPMGRTFSAAFHCLSTLWWLDHRWYASWNCDPLGPPKSICITERVFLSGLIQHRHGGEILMPENLEVHKYFVYWACQ